MYIHIHTYIHIYALWLFFLVYRKYPSLESVLQKTVTFLNKFTKIQSYKKNLQKYHFLIYFFYKNTEIELTTIL